MSDKFEYPSPVWLREAIHEIHTEMDEIRKHANDNCRKILTPASPFGLDVKHWYDMIHAYSALMKIVKSPNKNWNVGLAYRFAKRKGVVSPKSLSLSEIKDGLRFCRIKQEEARKRSAQS